MNYYTGYGMPNDEKMHSSIFECSQKLSQQFFDNKEFMSQIHEKHENQLAVAA